jgi:hypothetical protein
MFSRLWNDESDLNGALISGKVTLPPDLALVLFEIVGVHEPLVVQILQP